MQDKESLIQKFTSLFIRRKVPRHADLEPEDGVVFTTQIGRDLQAFSDEMFGVSRDRFDAYDAYDDMEIDSPFACSALDATADTAVSGAAGDADSVFEISFEKENARAAQIFKDLDERIQLRAKSWTTIRGFLKYGDCFREVVIDPRTSPPSIASLKPLPAKSMRVIPEETRIRQGIDTAFEQWDPNTGQRIAQFKPWQVVHFATKVNEEDLYGRSMFFSTRRTYRQLQMIEDSMVLNRLTRSTQRYVRTVPTPGMSAEKAQAYVESMKQRSMRKMMWDPTTGKMILQSTPMSEETDFWVPDHGDGMRGDVKVLQGQSGSDRIDDVEYFTRKYFAGLRVPPSFMGWESDSSGKAQIVTVDIAFARLVRRAQMTHGIGARQVIDTELALHGMDPAKIEYDIVYAPIATTDEMRRWQIELLKTQVAAMLKEKSLVVDDEYLLRHVLEVEEEVIKGLLAKAEKQRKEDEKKARDIASGKLPAPPGSDPSAVPGGQPPGEKAPSKDRPDAEPPVRGSKSEGVRPPRHVVDAVRYVKASSSFRKQVRELYEMTKPYRVKASHVKRSVHQDIVSKAAGVGEK